MALAAMTLGGVMMASGDETLLTAGRILSGCGAVVLNVLLTKMTTDAFEGREVVTALGVLITSWPLGIALALVTLPRLAGATSWHAAMLAGAGLSAVALVLVAAVCRPQHKPTTGLRLRFDLARRELVLAVLAGAVWAFYNMALILVLTFGPAWLIAGGDSAAHASALVSLVSWLILPALPLGAFFADRAGHPMTTMFSFFALAAAAIALLPFVGGAPALLASIGLIFGPPGGLIMALPGQAAPAERRAPAMGVYFTVYYVGMGIAPGIAGFARDVSHSAAAPLWLAVAMLVCAALSLAVFRTMRRTHAAV
jgi:predicted MFS family arabinose efflux permease